MSQNVLGLGAVSFGIVLAIKALQTQHDTPVLLKMVVRETH
jgi:hypothetical protein